MGKLLKIVIGIVGVFAIAVAVAYFLTSDMASTADEFFAAWAIPFLILSVVVVFA